ncbi:MAG TPA: carboxypeptidase-like regulatory domain-containing protein [Methylomirabilota bacterium]|nr:carboxypeptidase-like regulatory domain-containing protein [Methylomirabilota bacterium]
MADEVPETEVPTTPSPSPPPGQSAFFAWLKHPYLPHAQAIVGLLAGILSIGGFVYSYMWATTALPPNRGELVAVALDARTDKPIPNATLEVLTGKDALVTTLTPDATGRARQTIKEGNYRLRAGHPQFTTEVRQIHVIGGNTAEIRVRLTPRMAKPATPPPATPPGGTAKSTPPAGNEVGKAVEEGVTAVKKIFGQ